jgi:aminoglycoside 6-adenylyltransferase
VTDPTIRELIAWGDGQPDIRAMVLTSTRATGAPTDTYSDYDVILICTDVPARYEDGTWLMVFGEVVIDWWDPLQPDDDTGLLSTGNIVYYTGTRKIDFTLWPTDVAPVLTGKLTDELDAGYTVLLDKDGLTAKWPAPTGEAYAISLPGCDRYREAVNDFFIGVPYVATAMIRGEILPGKWVLDYDMRYEYLLPMLKWYAVVLHGDVRIGSKGKGLQGLLPVEVVDRLERIYAGMDVYDNLAAMDAMITLFSGIAEVVGPAIGCAYRQDLHDRVVAHTNALLAGAGLRQLSSSASSSST